MELLTTLRREATLLLLPLAHGTPEQLAAALKPRDEDYAAVFTDTAVEIAREGYVPLWLSPPRGLAKPDQTTVQVTGVMSSAFGTDSPDSREFPGGYKQIAKYLKPGLPWFRFVFIASGASAGMAYDGLVRVRDHWAWFPKPWRHLDVTS